MLTPACDYAVAMATLKVVDTIKYQNFGECSTDSFWSFSVIEKIPRLKSLFQLTTKLQIGNFELKLCRHNMVFRR